MPVMGATNHTHKYTKGKEPKPVGVTVAKWNSISPPPLSPQLPTPIRPCLSSPTQPFPSRSVCRSQSLSAFSFPSFPSNRTIIGQTEGRPLCCMAQYIPNLPASPPAKSWPTKKSGKTSVWRGKHRSNCNTSFDVQVRFFPVPKIPPHPPGEKHLRSSCSSPAVWSAN